MSLLFTKPNPMGQHRRHAYCKWLQEDSRWSSNPTLLYVCTYTIGNARISLLGISSNASKSGVIILPPLMVHFINLCTLTCLFFALLYFQKEEQALSKVIITIINGGQGLASTLELLSLLCLCLLLSICYGNISKFYPSFRKVCFPSTIEANQTNRTYFCLPNFMLQDVTNTHLEEKIENGRALWIYFQGQVKGEIFQSYLCIRSPAFCCWYCGD